MVVSDAGISTGLIIVAVSMLSALRRRRVYRGLVGGAVLLVARWLLGVVMRGVCRAWSGRASGGPGRPVRVEDRALAED
jgi:hypothetical protein